MHPRLRRGLYWAGFGVSLAGVVFVVLRLREYAGQLDLSRLDGAGWAGISVLSAMYGLSNLLLAFAWWHILRSLGATTSRQQAVRIYGISQLAKYVPGNVMHFAGRQGLGLAVNLAGRVLAKSVFWEIGSLSVAGALFGLLVLPLVWVDLPTPLSLATFGSAVLILAFGVCRRLGHEVGKALGFHLVFLLVSGLVFVGTLALVAEGEGLELSVLPAFAGVYVIAWLAGMLTPGAPAGVGIREMVLLFFFGSRLPELDVLLAVVLSRGVAVVGDVGFFAWAGLTRSGRWRAQG